MNYLYKLKFTTEAELDAIVLTTNEEGEQVRKFDSIETIVRIGTITKPATFDEEGNELTPAEVVDGWHADILAHELISELQPYCLDSAPSSPVHGYGFAQNDYVLVTKTTT